MSKKARIIEIVCRLQDDEGNTIMSQDFVLATLRKYKSIHKFAFIIHDKDVFSQADIEKAEQDLNKATAENNEEKIKKAEKRIEYLKAKLGQKKPPHLHIVLYFDDAVEIDVVARWFKVPVNFVQVKKGRGAFLDAVEYLTHGSPYQQDKGKYHYPDECVTANFDFRKEIDARHCKGKKWDSRDQLRHDVSTGLITLAQLCSTDEGKLAYLSDYQKLDKAQQIALETAPMPSLRINIYVYGEGGAGKGLISRAIARSIVSELGIHEDAPDTEKFLVAGADKTAFQLYRGQPVIIFDDKRAADIINIFGGRGNAFNFLDPHPQASVQNIKYGSVNLINSVTIINSVQYYKEFLNGLAGEYTGLDGVEHHSEDTKQSWRRFPIVIYVSKHIYSILLNKGWTTADNDYTDYTVCGIPEANLKALYGDARLVANPRLLRNIESQAVRPIIDTIKNLQTKPVEASDEDILRDYANFGKTTEEIIEEGKNVDDYPF